MIFFGGGVTVSNGTAFEARIVTGIWLSFQRGMMVDKGISGKGRVRRSPNDLMVEPNSKQLKIPLPQDRFCVKIMIEAWIN